MAFAGTPLVPFFWVHNVTPQIIRLESVVVGAIANVNFGATYLFVQLHRGNPVANQVPLFSVPAPPNGGTVIQGLEFLGNNGIASDNMWIALSQSQGFYVPAAAANGSVQLMIR